ADDVEPRFNDCLGDAFATYTMGPAYAFFAILLLLDPSSPFTFGTDNVADDVRVHAICEMLEYMNSNEAELKNPPYTDVRKELSAAWSDAISQTGAKPEIDEEKQLSIDKGRAGYLVKALWKTLKASGYPPFTVDVWDEIKAWVGPLTQN